MRKDDVLRHYKGDVAALADALDIRRQAIYQWGDIIPRERALELDRLTGGGLKFRPSMYPRKRR